MAQADTPGSGPRGPPETSLEEFTQAVARQRTNNAGIRLYNCLRTDVLLLYPAIKTVKDFDVLRKDGLAHSLGRIRQVGKKTCEELNRMLLAYGVEPIPWDAPHQPTLESRTPEPNLETNIHEFLGMGQLPNAPHKMGYGARAAIGKYVKEHPDVRNVSDLITALRHEGLSALASYATGMKFTTRSGESVNRTLESYGFPRIKW